MKKGPDFFEKSEPILHFCEAEKRDRTADRLNAILEQKHLQFPHFGIIVAFPLETKKIQNLLELSHFGEFSWNPKMLDKC